LRGIFPGQGEAPSPLHQSNLNKLHAFLNFVPPHHTAGTVRLVAIEEKVKGLWDWAVNLYLGPYFRKIANDALNGSASGPNNGGAGTPQNFRAF